MSVETIYIQDVITKVVTNWKSDIVRLNQVNTVINIEHKNEVERFDNPFLNSLLEKDFNNHFAKYNLRIIRTLFTTENGLMISIPNGRAICMTLQIGWVS